MPRTVDIFVESEAPLESFVKDTERLLEIKLQRLSDGNGMFYEFRNPHIVLTVGTHSFDNDRDMHFQDYRYHVSVRALNIATEEERKRWRDAFAQAVFQKLRETQRYHLMSVEDIQMKLEEFHPKIGTAC